MAFVILSGKPVIFEKGVFETFQDREQNFVVT